MLMLWFEIWRLAWTSDDNGEQVAPVSEKYTTAE